MRGSFETLLDTERPRRRDALKAVVTYLEQPPPYRLVSAARLNWKRVFIFFFCTFVHSIFRPN